MVFLPAHVVAKVTFYFKKIAIKLSVTENLFDTIIVVQSDKVV